MVVITAFLYVALLALPALALPGPVHVTVSLLFLLLLSQGSPLTDVFPIGLQVQKWRNGQITRYQKESQGCSFPRSQERLPTCVSELSEPQNERAVQKQDSTRDARFEKRQRVQFRLQTQR